MAIKGLCFNQVHKYAMQDNNWIILEFTWNNSDTFSELIQNNTAHFLSEFISHNTETFRVIPPHKTLFLRAHIKPYWHFPIVNSKQYYAHFSGFISHDTFSGSYYKIILCIFSAFISNNIDTPRVTTKQYCKFLSNETDIFRQKVIAIYYRIFTQKVYQTIPLSLSDINLF